MLCTVLRREQTGLGLFHKGRDLSPKALPATTITLGLDFSTHLGGHKHLIIVGHATPCIPDTLPCQGISLAALTGRSIRKKTSSSVEREGSPTFQEHPSESPVSSALAANTTGLQTRQAESCLLSGHLAEKMMGAVFSQHILGVLAV